MQVQAEAARQLGVAVAQIDHVVLVDAAIVVDIFVDGIASLELIGRGVIVVVHGLGVALVVDHHRTARIASNWGLLALGLGLSIAIEAIAVDALVAETIDGANGVVDLQSRGIGSAVVEVGHVVVLVEHHLVHLLNGVLVAGKVHRYRCIELPDLDELVQSEGQLPSVVVHRADILIAECREAGGARDAQLGEEHVVGALVIDVEGGGEQTVEQLQVDAEVGRGDALPLQVGQADVAGIDGRGAHVAVGVDGQTVEVKIVAAGLAAGNAPGWTHCKERDGLLGPPHEGFVADDPLGRQTWEPTVTVVIAKLCTAVHSDVGIEDIAALEAIVQTTNH